jgi:STE24 endopeptidase
MSSSCPQYPLYRQTNDCSSSGAAIPYLEIVVAFTAFMYALELYLDIRQLQKFSKNNGIPVELKTTVSEETFKKSISYRRDKFHFQIFSNTFNLILSLAFLYLGYLPFIWDQSSSLAVSLGLVKSINGGGVYDEAVVTWLFLALQSLVDTIMSLPFSWYSTFVVEQKHGFNKSTLLLFFQDKAVTLLLTAAISAPLIPAVVYIVRMGGPYFFLYLWLFLFVVSLVMMTLYPTLIAPLFNTFKRLEDGEIKTGIEQLAQQITFPLTEIFVVDGSKRSGHSNAYFYGFFKNKRIVLYDTLLTQVTVGEILAILGHELGHYKLWHTLQGFAVSQLYTLALFGSFAGLALQPSLFSSFGFAASIASPPPVFIALLLFLQTAWAPVDKLLNVLLTVNSRRNEFQADAFAVQLGRGQDLCGGLVKLSVENMDNFVPDEWYSAYHYSHPPLVERLRAVARLTGGEKDKKRD